MEGISKIIHLTEEQDAAVTQVVTTINQMADIAQHCAEEKDWESLAAIITHMEHGCRSLASHLAMAVKPADALKALGEVFAKMAEAAAEQDAEAEVTPADVAEVIAGLEQLLGEQEEK